MSSDGKGALYVLPNTLGDSAPDAVISGAVLDHARSLDYFIAEDPKSARAFLKRIGTRRPLQGIRIERLDHNTRAADVPSLLEPVLAGQDAGLLSEAGLPAIADPGANLVRIAHERGVRVVPLSGPSSIVLALCASGLDGQRFAFHGYLPVSEPELIQALKRLERDSRRLEQTQIFIETPYRNERTLGVCLSVLASDTRLCLATDLTMASESVQTRAIADWRGHTLHLMGRPTVFLLSGRP